MKTIIFAMLALLSVQAFAQRNDRYSSRELTQCLETVKRLENRIDLMTRQCDQRGPSRNDVELNNLRRENQRLAEENRNLQYQIDDLLGRNQVREFICVAGCTYSSGTIDTKYQQSATAATQLEAEFLAKKATQSKYSCSYSTKVSKCEEILSNRQDVFCSVACTYSSGAADEKYSAGARGRNATEAQINASVDLMKNYSCSYGVKVIGCSSN